ncbi:Methylamine utilization protein MauD [compost metagenome]
MTVIQVISQSVLWILVLALVVGFVTLPRANNPKRRLALQNYGLPVQDYFPYLDTRTVDGKYEWIKDNRFGRSTIVLFTSAGCKACNGLYPIISHYASSKNIDILLFIDGTLEEVHQKITTNNIQLSVFKMSEDLQSLAKVTFYPFAYYVSADGIIFGKGGVQTPEDLDLLLDEATYLESRLSPAS